MPKIIRNLSSPESREFWRGVERLSVQAKLLPPYKIGGKGENPIPLLNRIQLAVENECWLELSSTDVKKLWEIINNG